MADLVPQGLFLPTVHESFGALVADRMISGQQFAYAYSEIYHAKVTRQQVYEYICADLAAHVQSMVSRSEPRDIHALVEDAPRPPGQRALDMIFEICRHLHTHHISPTGLQDVRTFTQRKFHEVIVEKVRSRPELLDDWLRGALDGVRAGVEADDATKQPGRRLLEAFEVDPDYYATHFALPFIRDAVPFYHEKAKALISEDNPAVFEVKKTELLRMETARAEVYLNEPHRSDYVATITELFDLGSEKFQRP